MYFVFRLKKRLKSGWLFIKIKLLNSGAPPEKVINHNNGLLLKSHNFIEKRNIHSIPKILGVGRLIPVKGFECGIKAVELLIRSGYKVNYNIVGYGPKKKYLMNYIFKLKLEKYIKIITDAKVPMIVAINKMDLASADANKVLTELQQLGFGLVLQADEGEGGQVVPELLLIDQGAIPGDDPVLLESTDAA